jgi:AtzE family amidohydrolase
MTDQSAGFSNATALDIAAAIRAGEVSAAAVTEGALARIAERDGSYNSFTQVTAERARTEAARIDAARARGEALGPLAGVPYAVKNLFDIEGVTTLAGSIIDADNPPAVKDATAVQRLHDAGAVLVGALNMAEYAMGATTENPHYGPVHNPHDLTRSAGGSSGGSGAAVAGGLVPVTLGTDTNASIRVPCALCGVFGLKPTYGRLSRHGVRLFAASFDHVGPLARSVSDLAAFYDVMQGPDARDVVCSGKALEAALPRLDQPHEPLRIAVAEGYYAPSGVEDALAAVERVKQALKISRRIEIPEAARARAAAQLITSAESANLHFESLKMRPMDFDPASRGRFLAGTMIPAMWIEQAQRFRHWYRARVLELFRDIDIFIAPVTPCLAPPLGREHVMNIDGVEMTARRSLTLFTQPLSFIGLPIVVVPLQNGSGLPAGVQIVAAPWRELDALRVARQLERDGVATAPIPAFNK